MANTENQEKSKSIGGLWLKTSQSGKKFMSGNIEVNGTKHYFAVFKNDNKTEGSQQPDYSILASNYKPAGAKAQTVASARPQAAPKRVARPAPVEEIDGGEDGGDDLPF